MALHHPPIPRRGYGRHGGSCATRLRFKESCGQLTFATILAGHPHYFDECHLRRDPSVGCLGDLLHPGPDRRRWRTAPAVATWRTSIRTPPCISVIPRAAEKRSAPVSPQARQNRREHSSKPLCRIRYSHLRWCWTSWHREVPPTDVRGDLPPRAVSGIALQETDDFVLRAALWDFRKATVVE